MLQLKVVGQFAHKHDQLFFKARARDIDYWHSEGKIIILY